PHLCPAVARRDERQRLAVRRPPRLAVRARSAGELPRLAGRDLDDPDARDIAIVLERWRRNRICDPLAVRRELRIADGLQGDVVVEGDGAFLSSNNGWNGGKLECENDSENPATSNLPSSQHSDIPTFHHSPSVFRMCKYRPDQIVEQLRL